MTSRRLPRLALLALLATGTGAAVPPAPEGEAVIEIGELTVARMAGALIGGGAPALTAEERATLDANGNRNGRYDTGDVRLMLHYHPELVPTGTVQTSASPR
jgi:hypothetical protein